MRRQYEGKGNYLSAITLKIKIVISLILQTEEQTGTNTYRVSSQLKM